MPYSPTHKARTRQRIIEAAAQLFGKYGYEAISIKSIMEVCGLTPGGFYSHFESKQALYLEAVGEHEAEASLSRLMSNNQLRSPRANRRIIGDLLKSIPLGNLLEDAGHSSQEIKRAYTRSIKKFIAALDEIVRENDSDTDGSSIDSSQAATIAALCIGTQTILRSIDDDALANTLQQSRDTFIDSTLTAPVELAPNAVNEHSFDHLLASKYN